MIESCGMWSFMTGFFHLAGLFKVHPCYNTYHYFFLWLNNTTFGFPICLLVGHLDCFHLLPFMNSSAMNICVQVLGQEYAYIYIGYISRDGLLGHTVTSQETTKLFSRVAIPFYILTSGV